MVYIRSHDGLEQKKLSFTYSTPGLSDGLGKETEISTEVVHKLSDLVFLARYPKLKGTDIRGNQSLVSEYNNIKNQLVKPSSTGNSTGFVIDLTVPPNNPKPGYSKTADELGAWELAVFNRTRLFKFTTEQIVRPDGKPAGSYVSMLSVKFDKPQFTVFIANNLLENSKDPSKSQGERNGWWQTNDLIKTHAYVHLELYRRAAKNMEKVLQELFNRLLPLPSAKKPLAVSKEKLDEYMTNLGEFLTAIVHLEFWEKTCAWEKKDYPELTERIRKVGVMGITPAGLAVKCGSKPKLPDIPLPSVPIKAE